MHCGDFVLDIFSHFVVFVYTYRYGIYTGIYILPVSIYILRCVREYYSSFTGRENALTSMKQKNYSHVLGNVATVRAGKSVAIFAKYQNPKIKTIKLKLQRL